MYRLVLVRHGESKWNLENKFTGWTDVDLSPTGRKEADEAGKNLFDRGFKFKIAFTSELQRAQKTLMHIKKRMYLSPTIITSWKLNERHYGALQGLNKAETVEKYGAEQVNKWRRSADCTPPLLSKDDPRYKEQVKRFIKIGVENIPLGESLIDTARRVTPFYREEIVPALRKYEDVLVVAHGNSLRALIMNIENLSEDEIAKVEIPTAVPLVYELDIGLSVRRKYFVEKNNFVLKKN